MSKTVAQSNKTLTRRTKMIGLQSGDGSGENVGRCEGIRRGPGKNQFIVQAFKRRIFLSLLRKQKQLVQPEMTSEFRRIWIHRQRAIPVNRNFAPIWQGNVGAGFNLHFAPMECAPQVRNACRAKAGMTSPR